MRRFTFGSLFAGIGGFDLGFERAGFECKWQVEIDEYATKILEKHWPKVHRQRDIRECNASNLERVDCIIGGFPCQDISYAGRGAGLDGERSGLFFEAIRLVRELQPKAVVLENVAALLTRGMDRVLGTLAEVGYDAQWHCIPAFPFGVPQRRTRVFVIASFNSKRLEKISNNKALRLKTAFAWNDGYSESVLSQEFLRVVSPRGSMVASGRRLRDNCRVSNGVDRLRCLGNAIVPQVAEVVARMTKEVLEIDKKQKG